MERFPVFAALLIIDMQRAMDDPVWGRRNNPQALTCIERLLEAWRATSRPIYHLRHDSTFADSPFHPGQPGNAFKPEVMPRTGEAIVVKRTNSAFIATDLEARLRAAGHETLVIVGWLTNNSVEATARMAGNLGFDTYVVSDATWTTDKRDLSGRLWPAEDVHALSLANLNGEYARVVDTAALLKALAR
ncbi:MAG TPA: cysteine hydrolase family protein [Alphaproteobacteria bacterium]|nr:cysteine hydrolase family protein [Alphaproteobacteria bacterium]